MRGATDVARTKIGTVSPEGSLRITNLTHEECLRCNANIHGLKGKRSQAETRNQVNQEEKSLLHVSENSQCLMPSLIDRRELDIVSNSNSYASQTELDIVSTERRARMTEQP